MRRHKAILSISLSGGHPDLVKQAMAITRVTAAATAASDALGVIWPTGMVLSQPDEFIGQTAEMSASVLPFYCWIGFFPFLRKPHTCISTNGLDTFGLLEFEIRSTRPLLPTLQMLTWYVHDALLSRMMPPLSRDWWTIPGHEGEVTGHYGPTAEGPHDRACILEYR
jgi:hypothetical protein